MLFAAFEKKWWKSSDSKNDSLEQAKSEQSENLSSNVGDEEILVAAKNTDTSDWIKGEKKIEKNTDEDFEEIMNDDHESDEDEEVFSNSDNYEQVDPHAPPAFALDDKEDEFDEEFEDTRPSRKKLRVGSIKEFFNTEILYRYDIMNDDEREELIGNYRIELSGNDTSIWSINLGRDITVSNDKLDAPVVLKADSSDFLSIVNGKLNCQIALISKRVKIEGDTKKASLLQNILAPRPE